MITEFHGVDSGPSANTEGRSTPFTGLAIHESHARHLLAGGTIWVDLEDGRRVLIVALKQDYPSLDDIRAKYAHTSDIRVDRVVPDPNVQPAKND